MEKWGDTSAASEATSIRRHFSITSISLLAPFFFQQEQRALRADVAPDH
jgi:hypothetical protein